MDNGEENLIDVSIIEEGNTFIPKNSAVIGQTVWKIEEKLNENQWIVSHPNTTHKKYKLTRFIDEKHKNNKIWPYNWTIMFYE